MGKKLLLLRHGKADWGNAQESDLERALASRGVKDAVRIGQYLSEEDLVPDVIVSSHARRALQTAELLQTELGDSDVVEEEAVYEADLDTLLDVVRGLPEDAECVLLIGHNPGLEELCDELSGRDDSVFKTCTMAILTTQSDWRAAAAGGFKLKRLINPADLD